MQDIGPDFRVMKSALDVLCTASEAMAVTRFELLQASAIHRGRVTVTPKDSNHLKCLRGILGRDSMVHVVPEDVRPREGYEAVVRPPPVRRGPRKEPKQAPKSPRKPKRPNLKSTQTSAQPVRPAPPARSNSRRRAVR